MNLSIRITQIKICITSLKLTTSINICLNTYSLNDMHISQKTKMIGTKN